MTWSLSLSRRLLPLLVASALLLPRTVRAGEFRLVPSVAVKGAYDDNYFFSSQARTDALVLTVSPGLEARQQSERTDASLSIRLHQILSTAGHEFNGIEQEYSGKLARRLTPSLKLSGGCGWRNAKRPDSYLEETGLVVVQDSEQGNVSLAADFTLDERTALSAAYGYGRTVYLGRSDLGSSSQTAALTLMQELGRRFPGTKGMLRANYGHDGFTGSSVDTVGVTAGVDHALTETWSLRAGAGGRYTRIEFDDGSRTNRGWTADLSLFRRWETGSGRLTFLRDVTAAPGRGGATERNAATVTLDRRFTYELSGSLSAGYYRNRSGAGEFSSRAIDERTETLSPALRYEFTKDASVEASYQFTRTHDALAGTAAERNLCFLRFAWQYPLFE